MNYVTAIILYTTYLIAGACLLFVVSFGVYILTAGRLGRVHSDDLNDESESLDSKFEKAQEALNSAKHYY